jgi:predicted GNAT superfamily acetyltransferase
MPLGAAIVEVWVPGRDGRLADVVLGFDEAANYRSANGAYIR